MRIGHIELPVQDPLASMRHYVEVLGFALVANQGDRFIWVQCGKTEILLKPGTGHDPRPFEASPCVVLYTEHLDARRSELAARGVPLEQHGTCHHFQDPDGHWFQLVDPAQDHSS